MPRDDQGAKGQEITTDAASPTALKNPQTLPDMLGNPKKYSSPYDFLLGKLNIIDWGLQELLNTKHPLLL